MIHITLSISNLVRNQVRSVSCRFPRAITNPFIRTIMSSAARSPGNIYEDAFDAVGSTPLLKLKGPSEKTGCTIYGKCEFAECGAGMSVKARAAKWMLLDAEQRGLLQPGGTIVEATAGECHALYVLLYVGVI